MPYEHTAIDKKLVESPVDGLCGNPKEHSGDGVNRGGVKFEQGPQHPESGGVIETVTFDTDADKMGRK